MWWVIGIVVINVVILFTYAILNAASRADDNMMGDRQYEEN